MCLQADDFEYIVRKTESGVFECYVGSFPHIMGSGRTPEIALKRTLEKVRRELSWWGEEFEPAPYPVHLNPVMVSPPVEVDGIIGWSRAISDAEHGMGHGKGFCESERFGDEDAYRTLTHFGVRIFSNVDEFIDLAFRDLVFEIHRPWKRPIAFPPGIFDAMRFVEKTDGGHPYREACMVEEDSSVEVLDLSCRGYGSFIRLPEPITYPPDFGRGIASFDLQDYREGNLFDVLSKDREAGWRETEKSNNHFTVECYLYGRQRRRL